MGGVTPSSWVFVVIPVALVAVALVVGAAVGIVFLVRRKSDAGRT